MHRVNPLIEMQTPKRQVPSTTVMTLHLTEVVATTQIKILLDLCNGTQLAKV
jgi:hypothetical protein